VTVSFSFTLLFLILAAAAVLAIIDAVVRLRGKGGSSIIAIIELIVAILLVLSWFVNVPFGQFALAVALLIVLIVLLLTRRARYGITIAALILTAAFIVLERHWIIIPGING
jgi:hypothetical protein